jgi:hypothetical protein
MKFKTGLLLGIAAGYVLATRANEEQRARIDEMVGKVRDNPRVQQLTDTVSRDARKIGDAVQHRVTQTADRTSEVVVERVEPGKASTGSTASPATGSTASSTTGAGRSAASG